MESTKQYKRLRHNMLIETLYEENGEWKRLSDVCVIEQHGWDTPSCYVKEVSNRFPHRDPKPFRNGLEMRGDAGTLQRVWFQVVAA